jgi:hypothetical protein
VEVGSNIFFPQILCTLRVDRVGAIKKNKNKFCTLGMSDHCPLSILLQS